MYRYELEITMPNGDVYYKYIWADNYRDAQESGELMFPDAKFVDVC